MFRSKGRILVVDDETNILTVFKKVLEKAGFKVETASTGKDALEKICKTKYNVYLVDVKLPDMDGTELLAQIPNNPSSVKIIITGFSSEEVGRKAADYGADEYLVKPVKPQELIETIQSRLNDKKAIKN
jgi:two-component system, NtrC family, response regulator HydG